MKTRFLAGLAVLSACATNFVFAGDKNNAHLVIPTLSTPAKIDGVQDESQWQQAAVTTLNYEVRPAENQPAPVETEARIFATDTSIFVSFIARDHKPYEIRANVRARDKIFGDDLVGLKFDTFNDSRLAYNFFVNPYGAQSDSIENELTGQESDAWDGIWYSAATRVEDGYRVEMELPLSLFNFDDSLDKQEWGFEFIRYYPRDAIYRLSSLPQDRNNSCMLCQLGVAEGLSGAKQSSGLQITPSIVGARSQERNVNPKTDWNNSNDVEVGADIRWAITPSTLLNATVNPDFSQVEADAGQLNINTTFTLFVDEKRPFFLDNKDYFDTQKNFLHTRNIAAPDYGLKLTSKVDQHTAGLLVANDSVTNFIVPGNLGSKVVSLNEDSMNIAGRYRYDVSENLSIGTLLTLKDSDEYHNYLLSGDVKYQPTAKDTFQVQFAGSQTQYPTTLRDRFSCERSEVFNGFDNCEAHLRSAIDGNFTGNFYRLSYRHATRNWSGFAAFENISDDFRADLGFMTRADFNKFVVGGDYKWFLDDDFFHTIRLHGDWDITHSESGELLERESQAFIDFDGDYQSRLKFGVVSRTAVGLRKNNSTLSVKGNTDYFDETDFFFRGQFDPSADITLGLTAMYEKEIDFANNQLGKKLRLNPDLGWDITERLSIDVEYENTRFNVEGGRLYTANLLDFRLNWQFTVESFLRVSSIYTHIKRDPSLYKYSKRNAKFSNVNNEVLYGYKLNPLSVFYLGYSDGHITNDDVDSLTQTERRLFMKVSYAFVM
ncbi:hypothetical protein D5018_15190 [Parashewanella curva]|uniref:Uncharacterized protein n=1 Tax=Parashewanella curva TaxID=2338552 RepID=A0A3L8PU57_9GAMM|nr:carbohydrate binding family 9 domain-containing protein [Parashewanella curva]RLV58846.1 hypothetical protein D5018_15190 [Parashewanella curva]